MNLLAAGVANQTRSYSTRVVIPQYVTTLFIRQTDPKNKSVVKMVSVEKLAAGVVAKCDFKPVVYTKTVKQKAAPVYSDKASDHPMPATGVTPINSAITLMGSKYYIEPGTTITNIDFGWLSASELYVAGTLNINRKNTTYIPPQTKLVVLSGGEVNFSGENEMVFEQDGIIVAVHEGATINFEENAAVGFNAKFINDGTVTVAKQLETRQSAVVVNNNDLTAQNYVLTNTSVLVNNDYLHLLSGHRMNSNSTVVNNGTIQADVEFASNNQTVTVYNNNLIKTPFFNYGSGGGSIVQRLPHRM